MSPINQQATFYSQPASFARTVLEAILLQTANVNRLNHVQVLIEEIGHEEGVYRDIYKFTVYFSSHSPFDEPALTQKPKAIFVCAVDVNPQSYKTLPSDSLEEYSMLCKLSAKTDVLPKPIALIASQSGSFIVVKEYLEGETMKSLLRNASPALYLDLIYSAGFMFGRFFLATGAIPLDAHPGNLIVNTKVSPFSVKLCDSRGCAYIENPSLTSDSAFPSLKRISSRYQPRQHFLKGIVKGSEGCTQFHRSVRNTFWKKEA